MKYILYRIYEFDHMTSPDAVLIPYSFLDLLHKMDKAASRLNEECSDFLTASFFSMLSAVDVVDDNVLDELLEQDIVAVEHECWTVDEDTRVVVKCGGEGDVYFETYNDFVDLGDTEWISIEDMRSLKTFNVESEEEDDDYFRYT